MLRQIGHCLKVVAKFYFYRPAPVTPASFFRWLYQFDDAVDRRYVLSLLNSLVYLTENETRKTLFELNEALLRQLHEEGIPPDKVIYVQIHDPGSSSPVMLNLLRDAAHLERRGCTLADANTLSVYKHTDRLGEGAIVYIDDFVGTGNQFAEVHHAVSQQIVGTFTEFLLVAAICEEGIDQVAKRGVQTVKRHIDFKANRPLHPFSAQLDPPARARLTEMCLDIDERLGLGYHQLASMTVLYRNAPDTLPLIFRGSVGQKTMRGLLPRSQDLPVPTIASL